MNGAPGVACPRCARALVLADHEATCAPCGRAFPRLHGVLDLSEGTHEEEPWPMTEAVAARALADLDAGASWKSAFEAALLALDDERADHWMQLSREARAAWLVLLQGDHGACLCIGNALSGAGVALARAGWQVVLVDRSMARLRCARARALAAAGQEPWTIRVGASPRLPFADGAFELLLHERGLPQARSGLHYAPAEWRRVTRGEVLSSANNRWGYKRSGGRRGDFRVPSPLAYLRGGLWPGDGERTLPGHRSQLRRAGFESVRTFALYPHLSDFTHVVGLDGEGPELTTGPQERRNLPKVLAQRLGLFPWLTPSFAFVARRSPDPTPTRLARILADLAVRIGEPVPRAEAVLATRGNTTLVQTFVRGSRPGDPRGRWTVHFPLSEQQREQLLVHHSRLTLIRERFAEVPVPEPLWIGESHGLFVACERRLGGLTAPQLTGDTLADARMFADVARDFARLAMGPARTMDEADFERLVGSRFALVSRFAAVPATIEALARLSERMRASLVGTSFPRVLQHADLRSKHVQVHPDGSVIGYLDWGSSELDDLPCFDLLHLIAHGRKQAAGWSAEAAWQLVRDRRDLREHERRALDDYGERLGIDDRVRGAIEAMYPVLVAAMAERNWDYSRPRWLARQFGL